MKCPICETLNRDGALFCKRCSLLLVDFCPNCRFDLPPDASYCDRCAFPIEPEARTGWPVPLQVSGRIVPTDIRTAERTHTTSSQSTLANDIGSTAAPQRGQKPADGTPAALQRYIPGELLQKIEAARAGGAMVGERRVVTMLFSDVKGSTSAAEQLDPEEWTEIINGAFEHMINPVYRYEGTVARLMGDAILAFFGAPIAHEDDPQRAVLAGLDIVEAITPYRLEIKRKWGLDFNVRVGINTGRVVVGAVGSDLRMEYTAMGDAINLASRMEETAKPGTVQIAHDTYKLVRPYFDCEALGGITVKGKEEPVPTYLARRRKASAGRHRDFKGSSLPLVGRGNARRLLSSAMEQVTHGSGQIVCIIGDVGLGKSRLIRELRREWEEAYPEPPVSAEGQTRQLSRWYETFCLSYETARPYGLFQNLLRQVSGAASGDPPEVLQNRLFEFISSNVPAQQRAHATTVLETLFGLRIGSATSLEGETFKTQLYETITLLLINWASNLPGVIVCDDIHWSDPASVELLHHLFQLSDRLPLLFICALRPERRLPGWQIKTRAENEFPHRYIEVQIDPLSTEESLSLVSQIVVNDELPKSLQKSILTKAAGNPFFIEEVIRALIDNGSLIPSQENAGWEIAPDYAEKSIDIPDSLQSLLMARIDRLGESKKHTLQLAALIGRTFNYRVLKDISQVAGEPEGVQAETLDRHLGELQRLELISQSARRPELEYIFQQALVQESAYRTILHKQRREYHRRVGESIESLFPEKLDEQAIALAHHFSEAGEHSQALKYHTMAADMSYRLYANAEAVQHYTQALTDAQKTPAEPDQLIHLFTRRGRAMELDSQFDKAVENYKDMQEKARQMGNKGMELAALMPLATLYSTPTSIYNIELGDSLSQQTLKLAQDLDDKEAEARILWNLLNLNRFAGRPNEALDCGERSLKIAREFDLRDQIAFTLNDLSHVYNRLGWFDKTKLVMQESSDLWRELDNLPMLADSLATACYVHILTGEYDAAIAYSEEALKVSQSIQNTWGISYSQWMIGLVYWDRGIPDQAIRVMQESIRFADEAGFMVAQVYTRSDLAYVYGEMGDVARGFEVAQEAMSKAENSFLQLQPNAQSAIARLHLKNSDIGAAKQAIEAMRAEDFPIHINQPDEAPLAECQLALFQGERTKAISLLKQRLAALQQYGLRSYQPETTFLLGSAQVEDGQIGEAVNTLETGLRLARSVGSRWMEWQILALLSTLAEGYQADRLLQEAIQTVNFIAENTSNAALRQSFINRHDVQKLIETQPV